MQQSTKFTYINFIASELFSSAITYALLLALFEFAYYVMNSWRKMLEIKVRSK